MEQRAALFATVNTHTDALSLSLCRRVPNALLKFTANFGNWIAELWGENKPKERERKRGKKSLSSILIVCAVEVIGKVDGERGFTKEKQTDFKFS